MSLETVFLEYSTSKLKQSADRIGICLDHLTPEQVWARGTDNENSIGNLVLHLCGNVGQWIGTGVMGAPLTRDRDAEFAAQGGVDPAALKHRLEAAVDAAATAIASLPAHRLEQRITVQAYDVTVLEAVYHVVEHFTYHTGQIIFATKFLTGTDLAFYRHLKADSNRETVP